MKDISPTIDPAAHVREAELADLPYIHAWLTREAHGAAGFINNWEGITAACIEREMLVWGNLGAPVGFLTRGITLDTILQVRSQDQGRGIGRALVQRALASEERANNAVLVIQCMPERSVEFWRQMGFEPQRPRRERRTSESIYMQHLSTKRHQLAGAGEELQLLVVSTYPEHVLYIDNQVHQIPADRTHYVMAEMDLEARTLKLAHRVSIAHEPALGDPVVEVLWGGLTLLVKTKAKRSAAAAAGVTPTPNGWGWYLDEIKVPDSFGAD
ncbi:GNAT family N-acetyltransferase [Pseudomonas sp. EMN2]|uniref:GNAT family N-acetyltransferase n=1 Tax=Pseudomonas sp. EMN2 TaxID=2615212 RepID=UPI0015B662C7|nr:GNAT family N-acetyltransferase [Pseudomonas sp. EMN2]